MSLVLTWTLSVVFGACMVSGIIIKIFCMWAWKRGFKAGQESVLSQRLIVGGNPYRVSDWVRKE